MKKIMAVLCMVIAAALFAGCGPISDKKVSDNVKNTASAGSESAGNIEAEILKNDRAEKIVSQMTMDEKISQMIIPAIRTWNGENVTDLDAFPELKSVLQAHQYGGIILFGANITGTEQTANLVHELQLNNFLIPDVSAHIPYFMPLDQEGGRVIRLISGTRMTGNMAIGATGAKSEENAEKTGQIIGEELSALGFNVDYAPVVDVNNNPSNPVIGIRSFSDDPETVARLGAAYSGGLKAFDIIPTLKHFPGHGDTDVDSHIGTPSVEKTYEEIKGTELVPFRYAIDKGAEMIMTAHITYPLIDDKVIYGDGVTEGYYPATMSKKMITEILRGDLGFDGVVVTDALEMDAIRTAGLVAGEEDSTEYRVNIAEKVINSGVDILLLPLDLNGDYAANLYDEYIDGLIALVEDGTIPEERIDESVTRIIRLKEKYGILDENFGEEDLEAKLQKAAEAVGSDAHHDTEADIARQAVTMVRNEDKTVPLSKEMTNLVFLGVNESDCVGIRYAVEKMKEDGLINQDALITIDYYYDSSAEGANQIHVTWETNNAIGGADAVIALVNSTGQSILTKSSYRYTALFEAMERVHANGGKFVIISDNLPYDAARFQDADAILIAYMDSGLGLDPTDLMDSSARPAFNANVIAALETVFGGNNPAGVLPVNIPVIEENADGSLSYGSEYLYKRGFGLTE